MQPYPLCSIDGVIHDGTQASLLSVGDRFWLYGDGTFDTLRWHEGRFHLWERHVARLTDGAQRLGLHPPPDALLHQWCRALVEAGGQKRCVVRVTVVAQEGGGLVSAVPVATHTVITVRPAPPIPQVTDPVVSVLSALPFQPPRTGVRIKSNTYQHVTMESRQLALSPPPHNATAVGIMYANSEGMLVEGATSNLVAVIDGEIVTPPLSCGVLAGVTRGWLLDAAGERGWSVREELIPPMQQLAASGGRLYRTNAVVGIQPVQQCGDVRLATDSATDPLRDLRHLFWMV